MKDETIEQKASACKCGGFFLRGRFIGIDGAFFPIGRPLNYFCLNCVN